MFRQKPINKQSGSEIRTWICSKPTGCRWGSGTLLRWLWRQEYLDVMLGLGVLTVEMSSKEREAQPWIGCWVDGDKVVDGMGLVFCSHGREGKKEHWLKEGQWEYISSISSSKKFYFVQGVNFFLNATHIYQTHIYVFRTLKHVI